jgi:hypothetical protein
MTYRFSSMNNQMLGAENYTWFTACPLEIKFGSYSESPASTTFPGCTNLPNCTSIISPSPLGSSPVHRLLSAHKFEPLTLYGSRSGICSKETTAQLQDVPRRPSDMLPVQEEWSFAEDICSIPRSIFCVQV